MLSPGLLEGTCVFCWAGGGDVGSLFCGFVGMVGLGQRLGWMSLDGFPNLSVVPFYDSETFWKEEEEAAPVPSCCRGWWSFPCSHLRMGSLHPQLGLRRASDKGLGLFPSARADLYLEPL